MKLVKNKFTVNFSQISQQTWSIENHVKQFLLIFSPQIQHSNLHVKVQQGSMPVQDLCIDWSVYNILLFQLVKNAILFNRQNGSIHIQVMFRKEFSNLDVDSKLTEERYEVGKLVTVIKNTGNNISKERLSENAYNDYDKKMNGLAIA